MAGGMRDRGGGDEFEENHEINVTPFIDVMLVLLIIFMVAAPLATVDINVDLPGSTAAPAPRPDEPVFLTLKRDLSLSVGNEDLARDRFGAALDGVTGGDRDARVFLRADKAVDYGAVMEVMNLLRTAGYTKVALVGLEGAAAGGSEAQGREGEGEGAGAGGSGAQGAP